MKKLLSVLFLLFAIPNARATVAHVQGGHTQDASSVSTIAVTISAVGSGNTIVGAVKWQSSQTLTSVADDKGNTYTTVDTLTDGGWGVSTATFRLGNITNGPVTITATFSGSANNRAIAVDEYSGALANANPVDVHTGQNQQTPGTGTDGATSGAVTTTTNGDMIWGTSINMQNATNDSTAGTGFTLRQSIAPSPSYGITEDLVQGSAGSIAATFTQSVNDAHFSYVIAIKPAAGGGATLHNLPLTGAGN